MSDDRTLEPTRKRRKQARSEGRVVATPFLGGALVWLVVFAFFYVAVSGSWFTTFADVMDLNRTAQGSELPTASELPGFARERIISVSGLLLPGLLALLAVSVLSRLAQVGFLWVPHRVVPNFSRIDPANRWNQLVSLDSLVQIAKSLLLVCGGVALVGYALWSGRDQLAEAFQSDSQISFRLLCRWGLWLGAALLVFALLDYAFRRQRFEASLRMTPEEMRAEVKAVQSSSDVLAQRRRRAQS